MTAMLTTYQKQIQQLLSQQAFAQAADVWMRAAGELPDEPESLLLLAREFVEAGATVEAGELISLVAPSLKEKGKWSELLWALKLLARLQPRASHLRQQLLEAFEQVYAGDPRLRTVLDTSGLLDPSQPLEYGVAVADALFALKEGSYCHHKSWGYGRVSAFDVTLGAVRVDFKHRAGHSMQLTYAAESLTPLPADHIVARKAANLDAVKAMAAEEPLALVKITLHSFERQATVDQIEAMLSPDVVPADQWKRWWDNAKKLSKLDPHVAVPSKKTEPFVLREVPVSVQEELLESFKDARGLKARMAVTHELLRQVDEIADAELLLQEFHSGLVEAMRDAASSERMHLMEAALVCEELRQHQKTPAAVEYPAALKEVATNTDALLRQLDSVQVTRHAQAVELARTLCGERWAETFVRILPKLSLRLIEKVAQQLVANGESARLSELLVRGIRDQSVGAELLQWVCKMRNEPSWREFSKPMRGHRLFLAILGALEEEKARFAASRHASRLIECVMDDKELVADLLGEAEVGQVRDAARKLLASRAIDELTKRSVMARIIKLHPEMQELVTGEETEGKSETLIVSWPSFERRQAELEEIINKKIPENSRAIGQARSYGDLSENFEFKAAKEAQRMLQRRRAELERDLSHARASYFEEATAETIGVGNRVKVAEIDSGAEKVYCILGAWDSDPQRGIISYLSPVAKALLGKTVGDEVDVGTENNRHRLRVESIEKIEKEFLEKL